jgi:hypothetical protein
VVSRFQAPGCKLVVEKGGGRRVYSCADCSAVARYYERYDTFACTACDQWLDPCDEPEGECPFPKPPPRPSEVKS